MRALKCILAAFLAICLLSVPAFASLPEAGTGAAFYVQDEADVLSSETESQILEYNAYLERTCDSAQIVVVTVSYLDGDTDVAATRLMNDRGVGSAEQHNGMLLLLVANEARGWLAVGSGLDREFTDEMAGEYLDEYFWDDVDDGDFDGAVQTLTSELYDWYLDYYGVSGSSGQNAMEYEDIYDPEPVPQRQSTGSSILGLVVLILIAAVIFWFLGAVSRFSRMRRWGYGGGFFPIFWFGGRRRYNDWYRRQPPPPPGSPGPRGPMGFGGPGGFMGGGFGRPRSGSRPPRSSSSRPSAPRGGGFGGMSRGGGAGRSSGGSFRSGGGFHGGGFGGHSGGGGAGRR